MTIALVVLVPALTKLRAVLWWAEPPFDEVETQGFLPTFPYAEAAVAPRKKHR